MLVKAVPSLIALVVLLGLLSRATFGARGRAAQSAAIDLQWRADDTLAVLGSGFQPGEWVTLTLTLQSREQRMTSGPGVYMESSQSVSQSSSMTLTADDEGAFRFESTVIAPSHAEIRVTATGDRGSYAEVSRRLADIPR
jgi:hypothetical protein